MKVVGEKAAGKNVASGDIGLKLGEIAEAPDVIVVRVYRKRGVNEVIVFAVERVIEPDLSLFDRAGESKARKELVKTPSVLVLQGRDEIGGGEAEVVVADSGVEAEKAAGSFPGFGGFARGFGHLDGAESIGADPD